VSTFDDLILLASREPGNAGHYAAPIILTSIDLANTKNNVSSDVWSRK